MNFNLYSYKYNCSRWYGNVEGVKHLYVNNNNNNNNNNNTTNTTTNETTETVRKMATEEAKQLSGSNTCKVTLLNKFKVAIKSVETYPSLTGIDFKNTNIEI